ncbi:hypothetical protein GCT13_38805 [Paraburkholderia sp. CNPSo 3157]|uniref:Uncharacterized protein n=1 Tax=Paraburkholderia franconis TaxID=2654983 RepID=A0A7X1NII9_9BURK|nr:hypothetical protein [Paraburkholderia franconis]MPW22610.1 hypothetical protein [Paraburkholderia franconis]
MAGSPRPRRRSKVPACPPIGALMRYGERTVRVIIESVDEEGRTFRSTVKWANLAALEEQLF